MQDYASRLTALAPQGAPAIGPGTASALVGGYSGLLPGGSETTASSGYQMGLADNAPVTAEQRSIIETMLAAMNNAPRVR